MELHDRVAALNETRQRVWNEAKGFLDDLPDNTEMTGEQRAQWERYNERIDALGAEITDLTDRAQREQESAEVRVAEEVAYHSTPDARAQIAARNRQVLDWIRGDHRFEDVRDSSGETSQNAYRANLAAVRRERELIRAGASPEEVRDLAWDTGSVASAVPTLLDRSLYEIMEESIAIFRMPVTRITTASGAPMDFARVATHGIATQVAGQGTALAGTDPTFAKLTLTPVKHAQLIKVATEVVTDEEVDVISFLSRDLARAVGRQIDSAEMSTLTGSAFVGNGATVATGGSLVDPSVNKLIDLVYSVDDEYRNRPSTGWLMRDSTAGTIRKLRTGAGGTEGDLIWQPGVYSGFANQRTPDNLMGFPVFTDPNVASLASNAKIAFFGDWNGYYFRTVGSLMVERNDSVGFDNDQVHFRGKWRTHSGAQDVTAINLLKRSV